MDDVSALLAATLGDRYQVIRKVGEGGMAVVFLADDQRHGRRVALKVLRPHLAAVLGADRFLAEIRTTAHLQHPHILPLFDSGRTAGTTGDSANGLLYYVMPFVEGESLRQLLAREKQLPVSEAVRLACEIADALDYAHRHGVLHRDIKPENILLHDGRALVADFGIALAVSSADGAGRLTESGISLGTPRYMAPEQAMGERDLDGRTDVYALGATLYEMLSGEPPYSGATTQAIIARAATGKPRLIREIRNTVPEPLETAVLTALSPLPADRFATAADFARAIRMSTGVTSPTEARKLLGGSRAHSWRTLLGVAGLVLVTTALATRWWVLRPVGESPRAFTARVMLPLPADQLLRQEFLPFDISRDGSLIAYVADSSGSSRLYLRRLDEFAPRKLADTEGATQPFFSPDAAWIAYFANGKLWKVAATGGAPILLTTVKSARCGASWGVDDNIYFGQCDSALHRMSGRGGEVTTIPAIASASRTPGVTATDSVAEQLKWPFLLPDEKHALVSTTRGIGVLTLSTGRVRALLRGSQARYIASGHLLFEEDEGRMRLVPFDLRRLEMAGEPIPAFETFRGPNSGGAFYAVSENGTVVHVAGGFDRSLVLTDGSGRPNALELEKRGYRFPRFSPDGRLIAITVDPRPSDIWVADPARRQVTRLTTGGHNLHPIWSPDGDRILFTGTNGIFWVGLGGGEPTQALPRRRWAIYSSSSAADGRVFAFLEDESDDLVSFAPGDSAPTSVLDTPAEERQPQISPDGRWIAYASDVSGTSEIYLRAYPGTGASHIVSRGGGRDPRWSSSGREIVYRRGSSIMAVRVRTGSTSDALGDPRELFVAPYDFSQSDNWDVTGDGLRFVFVASDAGSTRGFHVVLNWFEEVRARSRTARAPN